MARPRREYGSHLRQNRHGIYVWRRTHPISGHRETRSTGERSIDRAQRVAREWEEEFDRAEVGLEALNNWRKELAPLAELWLDALSLHVSAAHLAQLRSELLRAFRDLGLRRCADLDAVGRLDERLRALAKKGASRTKLRRSYQDPLKRFSRWLAGNKRYLDRDPLREWEPLPAPRGSERGRKGRAFEPQEAARALLAIELRDRRHPDRPAELPMFVALLITAPRVSAFVGRDVEHLVLGDEPRIDLGVGPPNKRRGRGALDPATSAELEAWLGDRREGPLFPGPVRKGRALGRWNKKRLLWRWRWAFGLGLVDQLWPADEPRDLALAEDVVLALLGGRAPGQPGNPRCLTEETRARRAAHARRVDALAARLRESWDASMEGVTIHAFRSTHRTWAAPSVPGPAIDLQLGWAQDDDPATLSVMRQVAGSLTGRRHYLDAGSSLLDPGASARAVRAVLDKAVAALRAEGRSMLLGPDAPAVAQDRLHG